MRILVRPVIDPQREIDMTHRLIAAIAEELWRLYRGNEQLNWLEAELHLQRIVGGVRTQAREAEMVVGGEPGSAWTPPPDRAAAAQGESRRGRRASDRTRRRTSVRSPSARVAAHP
jgi:hypothetical protein